MTHSRVFMACHDVTLSKHLKSLESCLQNQGKINIDKKRKESTRLQHAHSACFSMASWVKPRYAPSRPSHANGASGVTMLYDVITAPLPLPCPIRSTKQTIDVSHTHAQKEQPPYSNTPGTWLQSVRRDQEIGAKKIGDEKKTQNDKKTKQ